MTCPKCEHANVKRFGTYGAQKHQRFGCKDCGATFSSARPKPLGVHTTDVDDVAKVFTLLTEGVSICAIARVTDVHKTTILSERRTDQYVAHRARESDRSDASP